MRISDWSSDVCSSDLDTRNAIVAALDITAAAELEDLEAIVRVTGTAAAPELVITSNPPRPQDEVLALLPFGKTTAQLSAFDAAQLASALAKPPGGRGCGVAQFPLYAPPAAAPPVVAPRTG